jgi:hypothetical protein
MLMLSVAMLNVIHAECQRNVSYAERHNKQSSYCAAPKARLITLFIAINILQS